VNGPKTGFSIKEDHVPMNTNVSFTNTTNASFNDNIQYQWSFGDGTYYAEHSPSHLYAVAGIFNATLIAKSWITGCTDSITKKIYVNNFQSAFSFSSSFITSNYCPPVLVSFKNSSVNASKVEWDFGDGIIITNTFEPSHLYTKAGKYRVSLTVTNGGGLKNTYVDSVIIKGPASYPTADLLHACTSKSIKFKTATLTPFTYVWDFGDGSIVKTTDSVAEHYYKQAGIYQPHLIAIDENNCPAAASLPDKIVIDSLFVSLAINPKKICAPKEIFFIPEVKNIASDQAQQTLKFHWNFGTGNNADTSAEKNPSFTYKLASNYTVSLKV
jgi:PKD repeat protein